MQAPAFRRGEMLCTDWKRQGWLADRNPFRRKQVAGLLYQTDATLDLEFPKQRGDVEFYRTLGDVQLRGDFLVCEVLKHPSKHLSLSRANVNRQNRGHAGLNELLSARHEAAHHIFAN